ncbi:hypothetical protein C369_07268 [Cryptococcus neoformans A5-35-17]|nr:hypothetical protein C369_07268 [Cryptococcus neoformans var. grubii A5-35-17]
MPLLAFSTAPQPPSHLALSKYSTRRPNGPAHLIPWFNSLDKAETYMGWREAWEEFMGKDELYLDKLMVETADWFELLDGVVE